MLAAHAEPKDAFDAFFQAARVHGSLVALDLNPNELVKFLDLVEGTANSAQNDVAMDRLGGTFSRLELGLVGEADPGWHQLRPGISRLELTPKQGQYLAFIATYLRLHRRAPAESEVQGYFHTSAPSVHEMLKTLQRKGFIDRRAGEARSIKLLLAPHEIPDLE